MFRKCLVFLLISINVFALSDLKKFQIPSTNYKMYIPKELNLCDQHDGTFYLCSKNNDHNLLIRLLKNNKAKDLYFRRLSKINKNKGIKFYGNKLVNGAYWLDYDLTLGNSNFRIFTIFRNVDRSAIEISYTLLNRRISSYVLEIHQKSLLSFEEFV